MRSSVRHLVGGGGGVAALGHAAGDVLGVMSLPLLPPAHMGWFFGGFQDFFDGSLGGVYSALTLITADTNTG